MTTTSPPDPQTRGPLVPTPDRPPTSAALFACGPCRRPFASAAALVAHVNAGHGPNPTRRAQDGGTSR